MQIDEKKKDNVYIIIDKLREHLGRLPTEDEVILFILGSSEDRILVWNS